jgi:hypothetical protein
MILAKYSASVDLASELNKLNLDHCIDKMNYFLHFPLSHGLNLCSISCASILVLLVNI